MDYNQKSQRDNMQDVAGFGNWVILVIVLNEDITEGKPKN
jgi:hypothetical protein